MNAKTLHITNGDALTNKLNQLKHIEGDFLVWREMFCEGPTEIDLESNVSIQKRTDFLKKYYRISTIDYQEKFLNELEKLTHPEDYSTVILWFEYDLFCHINMIAAISLLLRKGFGEKTIALVCSGTIKNQDKILELDELSIPQLQQHFNDRVLLNTNDIQLASYVWTLYCESDPKRIAGQIKKPSSFQYLSICLRAHLQRFPNMLTGLNILEHHILDIINTHTIKNMKQLMGYALEYQGFYGYGDMQMKRVIAKLFQFLDQTPEQLVLSERGKLALAQKKNFYNTTSSNWYYGGVHKYQYLYNKQTHKLLKL